MSERVSRGVSEGKAREGEGWVERRGQGRRTHLVDPAVVGGHAGEDRGLLEGVAAQPGAEADDAPQLPRAILGLAVQWAARVPLRQTGRASEGGSGSRRGSGRGIWVAPVLASACPM